MLALAYTLVLGGLFSGGFAVCGFADGRWRAVLEGGVPAVLLVTVGLLIVRPGSRR